MYDKERGLYIAHCANGALSITGKMANRHGLIAGATGTGKTVTLQVMAETFCQAGVPCFMADMKGDLSGISQVGKMSGFIEKRLPEFGIENPEFQSCPVRFFDVYGEQGHPMRATISQMGPQLLSRLMQLNETQDGVLNIVFRIADERGLLLIDLKDLRSMLDWVSQHAKEYTTKYGNISTPTIGAIQRALLQLENQGADKFFGEPSFDIFDLMQTEQGKGVMNVLAADKLMLQPKLYSTFLLWLLSELYSTLPEVGHPTDSFERGGYLLHHAKSDRYSREHLRPVGQPCATCATCLHAQRPEGCENCCRHVPCQSRLQDGRGHHELRDR